MSDTGIAIVGMAGRFPGAGSVRELWRNLVGGVESIRPADRPAPPGFVPAVAAMDGVELFDAPFFGISPAFAAIMDPQHRVFMEVAWEALEDAGCDPTRYAGAAGVYAGATANTYYALNLAPNSGALARFTPVDVNTANANDFLTTRFSYFAGLTGPSHAVQCACSTSLVAVCLACQAIADGVCDMALAGGVSVNVMHREGYRYIDGGMFSPDGHCRPFSASATGTVFGSGAGVVVLKPIADAIRDGDHIYAVIIGSATNNDGRRRVGFLAPGVEGQAQVVAEALGHAGVPAESIGFVEAHGTGTPLGDPIEVRALTKAFRESAQGVQFCRLGSVKSNVGHLDAAAGVTGLIKATLAIAHGVIPGTLHAGDPNPALTLAETPFVVNTTCDPWAGDRPRRAGVSAFGVGGTNAHVVLEEAPALPPASAGLACHLLVVSARSAPALRAASLNLARWLREHPAADLADVAYTLKVGRRHFGVRRAIVCRSVEEATALLERQDVEAIAIDPDAVRPVGFLFSSEPRRPADLPRLLAALAECEPALLDAGASDTPEAAVFVSQCALAAAAVRLGLKPAAVHADDYGELIEAVIAGSLPLDRALARIGAPAGPPPAESPARERAARWADEHHAMLADFAGGAIADSRAIAAVAALTSERPLDSILAVVGRAWERGAAIDWRAVHASERRRRVPLPTYPFEHQRYWIDPPPAAAMPPDREAAASATMAPRPVLAVPYAAPASPLHETISNVWGRALGIAGIGIDDNFFALGGDSLLAVRVAAELSDSLGSAVTAPAVYEALTVRRLAETLAAGGAAPGGGARREEIGQLRRSRQAQGLARRAASRQAVSDARLHPVDDAHDS